MNKKALALPILLVGGAMLTGCTTVDNVDEDDSRETKDRVYVEYLEDTYGENYPNLDTDYAVEHSLRMCSLLDSTTLYPADFDQYFAEQNVSSTDLAVFQDVVYRGVQVYCPDHLTSVEHLRPASS